MTKNNDDLDRLKLVTHKYIHTLGGYDVYTMVFVLDHKPSLMDFQAIRAVADIKHLTDDQFGIVEFEIVDEHTTTLTPHHHATNYPKHWKYFHYYLDFKPKSK